MKKLISVIMTMIMVMGMGTIGFAEGNDVKTRADTTHRYEFRNKRYLKTVRELDRYIYKEWAKTKDYQIGKTFSGKASLYVSATLKAFKGNIAAMAEFKGMLNSETQYVRSIPADVKRDSRLAMYNGYRQYSGKLYYIIDYGGTQSTTFKGSGEVNDPTGESFLVVEYR